MAHQSNNENPIKNSVPSVNHFYLKEFACGWGAAFINITITYPIYKVIFRQMLHGVQAKDAFRQIIDEGYSFLYRGMLPPLAQKTVSLSLMFGVFDATRRNLEKNFNINTYASKTIAGMVAGSAEGTLMPFERIQTLLADSTYHQYFRNTHEAFKYVWTNHGFLELYRGLVPILWRNGPSNALFFILREEASQRLPERKGVYHPMQNFMCGALIGAFLSTLFYPLNVLKVGAQSTMGGPYVNIATLFNHVYNERDKKIVNFYKGCSINFYRAFLSWGLINASYELLKKVFYEEPIYQMEN